MTFCHSCHYRHKTQITLLPQIILLRKENKNTSLEFIGEEIRLPYKSTPADSNKTRTKKKEVKYTQPSRNESFRTWKVSNPFERANNWKRGCFSYSSEYGGRRPSVSFLKWRLSPDTFFRRRGTDLDGRLPRMRLSAEIPRTLPLHRTIHLCIRKTRAVRRTCVAFAIKDKRKARWGRRDS